MAQFFYYIVYYKQKQCLTLYSYYFSEIVKKNVF